MTPEKEKKIRAKLIDDGDCLRWDSVAKTAHARRHPAVMVEGKVLLVRRVVYEMERGPLRPSIYLAPTCGDECCVKPEHQKQLTKQQKNTMGAKLGASAPGRNAKVSAAARKRAKLTVEAVQEIRNGNATIPALAQRFGVHEKAIWLVRQGLTWKDYSSPFRGLGV
jgi:hypothetical protein